MRPLFDLITLTAASVRDHHLVIDPNTYSPPGTTRASFWPAKTEGFGYQGEQDNSNNCTSNLDACLPSGGNRRAQWDGGKGAIVFQANWASGLLKEESDTVKETRTCPWYSGAWSGEHPRVL